MGYTRILIVEDNATVAQDCRDCLEDSGHCVVSIVASGEDAIERARTDRPDLVLMDIRLRGDMDGIDAAGQIYTHFGIPIVFLTAFSDRGFLERAREVGSFGYLLKPFNERELIANIEMTLYKANAEKELRRRLEENQRYKEKLQALTVELSAVEEKTRKAVSYELHENIAQLLGVSLMYSKQLRERSSSSTDSGLHEIVVDHLDKALQYTLRLTHELFPPSLWVLGLDDAVQWLLKEYEKQHQINSQFTRGLDRNDLPDANRAFLYRAIQELLTNTAKHAQATHVKLSTWKTEDTIGISVKDNGIGFEPLEFASSENNANGFGLFGLRERINNLDGKLTITARPGQGTQIIITVPKVQQHPL